MAEQHLNPLCREALDRPTGEEMPQGVQPVLHCTAIIDHPKLSLERVPSPLDDVRQGLSVPVAVWKDELQFAVLPGAAEPPFPQCIENRRCHWDLAMPGPRLRRADCAPT